jgi:endonuclease YncB( thermonuclease family)
MGLFKRIKRYFYKQFAFNYKDLDKVNENEIDIFTFNNTIRLVRVVDIYDGDTITILFDLNYDKPNTKPYYIKKSLRLYGFDAPEMRPLKTIDNRELHIHCAKIAKNELKKKIVLENSKCNKIKNKNNLYIWVRFMKEEKYGRAMGNIYWVNDKKSLIHCPDESNNLCRWMINNKLGLPYKGGKKDEFTNDKLEIINTNYSI